MDDQKPITVETVKKQHLESNIILEQSEAPILLK